MKKLTNLAFIFGWFCLLASLYYGAYLGEYDRATYMLILGIWGVEGYKK